MKYLCDKSKIEICRAFYDVFRRHKSFAIDFLRMIKDHFSPFGWILGIQCCGVTVLRCKNIQQICISLSILYVCMVWCFSRSANMMQIPSTSTNRLEFSLVESDVCYQSATATATILPSNQKRSLLRSSCSLPS